MGADELFSNKPRERRSLPSDLRERIPPELLADDRRALGRDALGRRKLLKPRGQERLDGRRNGDLPVAVAAALRDEGEHLLDEQWVSLGRRRDSLSQIFREVSSHEQVVDQRLGVGLGQRLEQDRRRVVLATAPTRTCVQEVRPRDAQEEDGCITAPVGDVVDEVEKRRLCPVQVVENEDQWTALGE